MKKIIGMLLAVVMLFGSCLSLASCSAPKDPGAEISVYLGDTVFDFDPSDYYVDSNAENILSLMYEPLFKIDSKGKLKCALADDYKVYKDERKIVINLRESYWSDEIRVKAEDFVYAWRDVILESNNANPAAALFYDIENAVAIKNGESLYSLGVEATKTYQLTITYREGANYKQLLKNLASVAAAPLRQDIVSVSPGFWSKDVSTIVTNGPFKLEAYNVESGEFTLARNLGYHQKPTVKDYDDIVNPASLVTFVSAGEEVALTYADVANKTVFYLGDAPLDDRAANQAKAKKTNSLSTYSYVFNTDKKVFQNENVRRALSLALDRAAMASAVTFGTAANGFLPDSVAKSIYGKKITDRISTGPAMEEAKALLAQVTGLTASDKKFTLTINDDEASKAMAELAKTAWAELGFTVTVKTVSSVTHTVNSNDEDIKIYDSAIQNIVKEAAETGVRNFDVIAVDWQMYSKDAFVALAAFSTKLNGNGMAFADKGVSTNRTNISGWTNADYDALIDAAYSAEKSADRKTALKDAEAKLLESCAVIPVIYNQNFAFINKNLSKVGVDGLGHFVFTEAKQKDYHKYLPAED